eukprot:6194984-Pleurochrysis_carterae.AAC.1
MCGYCRFTSCDGVRSETVRENLVEAYKRTQYDYVVRALDEHCFCRSRTMPLLTVLRISAHWYAAVISSAVAQRFARAGRCSLISCRLDLPVF